MGISRKLAFLMAFAMVSNLLIALVPAVADTASRSQADVTVTDISVSADLLFVGDNITITATIKNLGTENGTDVTVIFEAGAATEPLIDLGTNSSIGDDNGGQNLTENSTLQVSVSWNTSEISKQVTAGLVYSINVTATNNTDGNTTNDTLRLEVVFQDTHHLKITEMTPSATTVRTGDPFDISYKVENIGSQALPALGDTLHLLLDNETIAINTTSIQDLGPKEATEGTFEPDTSGYSVGNHTFTFKFTEAEHNLTTDNITFTYPNLYIGEINWTPFNGTVGDIIVVNATIHNNGTANATHVYVRYFVDVPYLYEAFNETVNVTAGGTNVSTFEWNTTGLQIGNHSVKVSLGPDWDSENFTGNITLEAGGLADLAVTSVELVPNAVDIGEVVNITATIRNVGDWPSEATNVSFKQVKGLNSTHLCMLDIGALQPGQSEKVHHLWNTTGLEFWTYIVWVQVDPEGNVEEEVLINNKGNATLTLRAKPDLTVTEMNMTKGHEVVTSIPQGESATINIKVENVGTKKSETTRAGLYLDQGPTPVGTMKLFGLAVDGSYGLQYHWDTTDMAVGNHTFRFVVDIDGNNTEIDEDNNEMVFNVTVLEPEGVVDLAVDSLSINPPNPRVGDHVVMTTTVKNLGSADAENVTLLFAYVTPGGNVEIDRQVIPLVKVGEEVIRTTTWTTGTLSSDNYTLNISIDPLNEIREDDRSNNYKVLPIFLSPSGSAMGKPDLRVTDISFDKEKPEEGDKVTLTILITNLGDGEATNVRVVLYVDDIEKGTKTITTITKDGGTGTVEFEWEAKKGMHEVKAVVYAGTSSVSDDHLSKVVKVRSDEGAPLGDYMPILLIIIVLVILAIALIAMGRKQPDKDKGFIEEEHDEEAEEYDEEE